jgi:peptidoglycan/LPS O-acetylase OafA/YrhL
MVWAAAVGLIAYGANRNRRSAATASPEAPAYWRTLGLITYPFYLTHNVIGTEIIRILVDAGLDATLAVFVALAMLGLVCWFICAKIEPAVRGAMTKTISYFGQLPERMPVSRRTLFSRGLARPSQDDGDVAIAGALSDQLAGLAADPLDGRSSAT